MKDFNSYFESIPELETERLRLTAFTREDMDAYFDILRDPKVKNILEEEFRFLTKNRISAIG